jgi:predicted Zn-dependent peptidase
MENITIINTDKFKNNSISVTVPLELDYKTTDYNLLAAILKRGCNKYSSTKVSSKYLQELYGAFFDIVISKKGEKLFLNFYIQLLDNKYAIYKEDLLKDAMLFLKEFIYNPLIIDGKFNNEYFQTEKQNLKTLIVSRIDNKDEYAIEKAMELCCMGEPYSIYKYGNVERLEQVDNAELVTLWKEILGNNNFYFSICGSMEENYAKALVNEVFHVKQFDSKKNSIKVLEKKDLNEVTEKMNVNQGKLTLCFKSKICLFEGDYFALAVMNSILGGGTHSKLFNEVREKNSLAYYSYSFVEKFMGILVIAAGIDRDNFQKAKEICLEQVENIKINNITAKELDSAKSKLISDYKTIKDSQYTIIDYLVSLRAYGIDYSIDDMIMGISDVTMDRVVEAAQTLSLTTVYFIDKE